MFEALEAQRKLTGNQKRLIATAMLGDMFEFFDYFLIGFVLAEVASTWKLTFLESSVVLLASGVGAILGAVIWGRVADSIGRRTVFMATILNLSVATFLMALTPDRGWWYLTAMRFFVGFGVGGLYCVDLPLVQEFVPSHRRGRIGGLVTAFVPVGLLLGSLSGAFLIPYIGWRGVCIASLPICALILLVRAWVPESPLWLLRQGRGEEARRSLAWALEVDPSELPLPAAAAPEAATRWRDIFAYPRSLAISCLGNLGVQTGSYGLSLWIPTLFVLILHITPARAASMMIAISLSGLVGRLVFSYLSDAVGRRASGGLLGLGAGSLVIAAAFYHDEMWGSVSVFWLILIAAYIFVDGGFAIVGPYSAEVWPMRLRTTGMGAAYGFGGIGKIIGPLGLALIIGSNNVVKPEVSIEAIVPAFAYLGGWFLLAGFVYAMFGIETRGASQVAIEAKLSRVAVPGSVGQRRPQNVIHHSD